MRVEALYESDTFWLDQSRIPSCLVRTPEVTLRRIWRVQREGNREVRREIEFYDLNAIISVGCRINSAQAAQFRIWACGLVAAGDAVDAAWHAIHRVRR